MCRIFVLMIFYVLNGWEDVCWLFFFKKKKEFKLEVSVMSLVS